MVTFADGSHGHTLFNLPAAATVLLLTLLLIDGTLCAFILVCASLVRLRQTDGRIKRPFRVSVLGILFCLVSMAGLPLATWLRLIVWLAIGLMLCFSYGRHHATPVRSPAKAASEAGEP